MKFFKSLLISILLLAATVPAFAQTTYDRNASGLSGTLLSCVDRNNIAIKCVVPGNVQTDPSTGVASAMQTYRLVTSATITSGSFSTAVTGVAGRPYIIACTATAWNSATLTLQTLGPDAITPTYIATTATWSDPAGAGADKATFKGVEVGANATLRFAATGGSPTNVNCTAS